MNLDAIKLRPRLILSVVVGICLAVLLPSSLVVWQRALIAWCVVIAVYMVLIGTQLSRATSERIKEQASALDDSAWVILTVALAATAASFGAIGALLVNPPSPATRDLDITLAGTTMLLSWLFLQMIFAVHYTHIFYGDEDGSPRGGLQFQGDDDDNPDFWDFVYFTVSIGATAQTSDTGVTTKRMRRIVTAQAIYSFFFNTAVLATAINIGAGLAGH